MIAESIGVLDTPHLAEENLTKDSVILNWRPPRRAKHLNISFRLQVKEFDDDWTFHEPVRWWLSRNRLKVKRLHPYVSYKVSATLPLSVFDQLSLIQ